MEPHVESNQMTQGWERISGISSELADDIEAGELSVSQAMRQNTFVHFAKKRSSWTDSGSRGATTLYLYTDCSRRLSIPLKALDLKSICDAEKDLSRSIGFDLGRKFRQHVRHEIQEAKRMGRTVRHICKNKGGSRSLWPS